MSTTLRPLAAAASAITVASVLAGCSLLGGGDDVFALKVGDCMAPTELETTIDSVPIVPCSEPHESEVFASFQLDDGAYPGDSAVAIEAEGLCLVAFEDFIGVPYDDSAIFATTITPTEDSWNRLKDREVLCVVIADTPEFTGTLRGANR